MTEKNRIGTYMHCTAAGENYKAYLPPSLPPVPAVDLSSLHTLVSRAERSLGKLEGVSDILPNSNLLLYYYIRKEAVLSSQIEGTQSSLSDLLLYESNEAPSTPVDDVQEVSSYVAAMEHGLARIREGFPLSLRLIKEMHETLLSKGRGSNKQPGEFRTSQNWIGGSRPGNASFVPPPPEHLMDCLGDLEKYLHAEKRDYSPLIDAGLIHVQFETIHPFLDGNGRIGRLLVTFWLMMRGELKQPLLYLSLFFKNNRTDYYRHLNTVREQGDWEGWLAFFLTGVADTADQVVETSYQISKLLTRDEVKIRTLGRAAANAGQVHHLLRGKGILSALETADALGITAPTARAAFGRLQQLGIVRDISGKGKERLFVYSELIDLLEQGTEPINY